MGTAYQELLCSLDKKVESTLTEFRGARKQWVAKKFACCDEHGVDEVRREMSDIYLSFPIPLCVSKPCSDSVL